MRAHKLGFIETFRNEDNMIQTQPALQEILFGAFIPPQVFDTRKHQFGFVGEPRYVDKKPSSTRDKTGLNNSERKVFAVTAHCAKAVSAAHVAKKVKMTRNHCGMVLGQLFKMGLLTRYKVRENGTNLYMYSVKKDSVD